MRLFYYMVLSKHMSKTDFIPISLPKKIMNDFNYTEMKSWQYRKFFIKKVQTRILVESKENWIHQKM